MNTFRIGKIIDAWMQSELRPLHCACEWGNIFGVEWLVTHGANFNVKDKVGLAIDFIWFHSSLIF